MKTSIRYIVMPVILTFSLLSISALAQDAKAPGQSTPSASAPAMSNHSQKNEDLVEQRIKELHAQLKITDKQSPQWDAFAQTMRDNAQKTRLAFHDRAQKLSSMDANEAMNSYASLAQLHADNMKSLASSMRDLYSVLSDDQKSIADSAFRNERPKPGAPHKQTPNTTSNTSASVPLSK
jgi:periplasmic protein CpxP/Spy